MDNKALDVYNKAVAANFSFLKSANNVQEAYLRAIPIDESGLLVPVCKFHQRDSELLRKLTEWRNENVDAYPTQFVATIESTTAWMEDRLLAVKDRVLFLIADSQGKAVGHIGFNNCCLNPFEFEIDNVVRGDRTAIKGIVSKAMIALMEWARKTLNVGQFSLRVMDDNLHAIEFYKRNEFVEDRRIPLVREDKNGTVSYRDATEYEEPVKRFVRMVWQPRRASIGTSLILTAGPSISAREAVYSFDAAVNGWNSSWSKYLTAFEKQFAEYVGVKYALATSSCTGALQIALMALDIGPGDEVIVPDLTWVATANAVRYVGALPMFADIELDSWNIDVDSAESLVTTRTKAIVAVHLYGYPARMNKVLAFAEKHGLKVVEDAAPAVGAEWQGKRCGSFGDFAAFSFQGAKLMVTGEGGMLVTDDDSLYQRALKIWDQGRDPSRAFWIDGNGVKFKMSNLQGAFGLAQLERVDEMIEMKRRLFSWYQEGLEGVPHLTFSDEVEGARGIHWMTSILLDADAPIRRDDLILQLKRRNVDTRRVFPAISQYPIWPTKSVPRPNALYVGENGINLPSGVCLSKEEIIYVCRQIREVLK
jgi:perosamine synthetase